MFEATTKILVVDDMLTMRMMIKNNLKGLGLTIVQEAKDGNDAWRVLEKGSDEKSPFQLILSDWNMPNLSGLQFLKKVRADERFKTLPFVLITAESEQSQIIEAIKSGVTHYIMKPFTAETLKEKLVATYNKVNAPKQQASG